MKLFLNSIEINELLKESDYKDTMKSSIPNLRLKYNTLYLNPKMDLDREIDKLPNEMNKSDLESFLGIRYPFNYISLKGYKNSNINDITFSKEIFREWLYDKLF